MCLLLLLLSQRFIRGVLWPSSDLSELYATKECPCLLGEFTQKLLVHPKVVKNPFSPEGGL